MLDLDWYKGKRVFVTGHTGFKGSWMCRVLQKAGAEVTGYALNPPTEPALFDLASLSEGMHDVRGDIRDLEQLQAAFREAEPEIVIHMAAQPIVRESYREPRMTYETNVMGTVHLLECVRSTSDTVRSVLNVTTDKVYLNREWAWGYREDEMLDGFDPYSNSKSCSELVTHSYVNSFFQGKDAPVVSTARAGNVIGGGDFASDRIIPDCVRAVTRGETIHIRNPYSTRPYQHVLEPVCAYLLIAQRQAEEQEGGPGIMSAPMTSCVTTGELVDRFVSTWGKGARWETAAEVNAPHEANFLKLDCSKIRQKLGWKPVWDIDQGTGWTVAWTKAWLTVRIFLRKWTVK